MRALVGVILAFVVALLLWRRWRRDRAARAAATRRLFGEAGALLDAPAFEPARDAGYPRLVGRYAGEAVQIHPVVDTLAVRRLPALWLLVTLRTPLPVGAKLDVMMRPNAPTTFSNFDHLPDTLPTPAGFPAEAVLRSDDGVRAPRPDWLSRHVDLLADPRAKELLITPQGLRIVWLLAEGERARYGVFRQAAFGDIVIEAGLLRGLLERLLALRAEILARGAAA